MAIWTRTLRRFALPVLLIGVCAFLTACSDDQVNGNDCRYMTADPRYVVDPDTGEMTCQKVPDVKPENPGDNGFSGSVNKMGDPNQCDMTGTWMAQLRTVSHALGFAEADAYNWFYYELEDNGDAVTIQREIDCGFVVCNISKIKLTEEVTRALALHNRQDGNIIVNPDDAANNVTVAPRSMTYSEVGDGMCSLSMERWWSVRSDGESAWPARDQYATWDIGDAQANNPLPDPDAAPAASAENDWDNDGTVGIKLNIDNLGGGWRSVIQRDWNAVAPTAVKDGAVDFVVPAQFNNEEAVFDASSGTFATSSTPAPDGHSLRFVKIDGTAPPDRKDDGTTNIDAILDFCEAKVNEYFRKEDFSDYCDMREAEQLLPEPTDDADAP